MYESIVRRKLCLKNRTVYWAFRELKKKYKQVCIYVLCFVSYLIHQAFMAHIGFKDMGLTLKTPSFYSEAWTEQQICNVV